MALTDADRLQMVMMALGQHSVFASEPGGDMLLIDIPIVEAIPIAGIFADPIIGISTLIER